MRSICGIAILFVCSVGILSLGPIADRQNVSASGFPDNVSELNEQKLEVSKLDWIMLLARVRILEHQSWYNEDRSSISGIEFDSSSKSVVIKAFVGGWIENTSIAESKKIFMRDAAEYCAWGLGNAEAEAGFPSAAINIGQDCSVEFWTQKTSGKGEFKNFTNTTIARVKGGQILLEPDK